jgi:CheY-like chemotaxis protein
MVVEDDPAVRMLVLDLLRELGYQAYEAEDAKTALPLLESDLRVDLLVTDVGLPGMNGRQLAEIARQHRPGLKVLFMTGYAQKAAERQGFLEDGMDMVAKPFAIELLASKIRTMISQTP